MKANIVRLLRTTPDRVNVKARIHEKVLMIVMMMMVITSNNYNQFFLPIHLFTISCYYCQVDSVGEGRAYEVHVVVLLE